VCGGKAKHSDSASKAGDHVEKGFSGRAVFSGRQKRSYSSKQISMRQNSFGYYIACKNKNAQRDGK